MSKKAFRLSGYDHDGKYDEEMEENMNGTDIETNDNDTDDICCLEDRPYIVTRRFPYYVIVINILNCKCVILLSFL